MIFINVTLYINKKFNKNFCCHMNFLTTHFLYNIYNYEQYNDFIVKS